MPGLESLSKDELIGVIRHYLNETIQDHPFYCAACCNDKSETEDKIINKGKPDEWVVKPLAYVCDNCNSE